MLENYKLKRLFDALKYKDIDRNVLRAQSPTILPAILITDAQRFHDILSHLQKRQNETKVRVWNWHVITYVLSSKDGFPASATRSACNMFLVFLFGYNEGQDAKICFKSFFTRKTSPMKAVYRVEDMDKVESFYRRRAMPWLIISTVLVVFGDYIIDNMVIVNVNGGPKFTYLGMVCSGSLLL